MPLRGYRGAEQRTALHTAGIFDRTQFAQLYSRCRPTAADLLPDDGQR